MKRIKTIYFSMTILAGCLFATQLFAAPIIPNGNSNNLLYYKIGGGSAYAPPAVTDINTIHLGTGANLNLGNSCGMFNPALSIQNTLSNLKDEAQNLTQSIIGNATGSITQMPMYFLAQANPTMYHLLNNALVNAKSKLEASVKSCEQAKEQIARGKNPYQDWATLSVGDSWKKNLSLTGLGSKDINEAKKEIEETSGDDGVSWVQGNRSSFDTSLRAGGKGQPAIHAVSDTVKAGYNAMLNRDLTSTDPAPSNSRLAQQFVSPQDAANWITHVLGDQVITTCKDSSCTRAQGGIAGRGLLSSATTCHAQNQPDCVDTLRTKLQHLITGNTAPTKENLMAVSSDDLLISPQVIQTLKNIDPSQQGIFINKLAQEIAVQRLLDKAFIARSILQTGSQIPVIASNKPAQEIIQHTITELDNQIKSLRFESEVRKQMASHTLSALMSYDTSQQERAFEVSRVSNSQPMLEHSAILGD